LTSTPWFTGINDGRWLPGIFGRLCLRIPPGCPQSAIGPGAEPHVLSVVHLRYHQPVLVTSLSLDSGSGNCLPCSSLHRSSASQAAPVTAVDRRGDKGNTAVSEPLRRGETGLASGPPRSNTVHCSLTPVRQDRAQRTRTRSRTGGVTGILLSPLLRDTSQTFPAPAQFGLSLLARAPPPGHRPSATGNHEGATVSGMHGLCQCQLVGTRQSPRGLRTTWAIRSQQVRLGAVTEHYAITATR